MKKSYITIAAIMLCVGYGVLSWEIMSYSDPPSPANSRFAQTCSITTQSDEGAPEKTYDLCCIDYHEALEAVKVDWQNNLEQLTAQEKPASEMVDEAYESLRTYDCWMEYICRAVLYSGYAPLESSLGTGLKEEHLGIVPGCQAPDNLRLESEYNQFLESLSDVPLTGVYFRTVGGAVAETFADIKTENKINYFPRCQTDEDNNRNPLLVKANSNFEACKRALELQFGCPENPDPNNPEEAFCPNPKQSNAFAVVENKLKSTQAEQKSSALERKLASIITKMHGMESHVGYLSNYLQQLNNRFACYAAECD
ncbi:hypothetical protein JXD20_04540 [Candidatus Peregrinibacteria bacterium]|nr:hypothetical protein [Candidatus Peregrinibacteria bacterium]